MHQQSRSQSEHEFNVSFYVGKKGGFGDQSAHKIRQARHQSGDVYQLKIQRTLPKDRSVYIALRTDK